MHTVPVTVPSAPARNHDTPQTSPITKEEPVTSSPSLGVSLKTPSMSSITILGIVAVLLLVLVFSLWQWKKWRQSKKRIVEGREIMMSKKLSEGEWLPHKSNVKNDSRFEV